MGWKGILTVRYICFSGRIGEQVAAKGVTVVDDGTMTDRRGSITIDDEAHLLPAMSS